MFTNLALPSKLALLILSLVVLQSCQVKVHNVTSGLVTSQYASAIVKSQTSRQYSTKKESSDIPTQKLFTTKKSYSPFGPITNKQASSAKDTLASALIEILIYYLLNDSNFRIAFITIAILCLCAFAIFKLSQRFQQKKAETPKGIYI